MSSDPVPTLWSWTARPGSTCSSSTSTSVSPTSGARRDVTEWNLEVVAAFMRAAYGKGYCDALTEDSPGSLCHEHGYGIPGRPQSVACRADAILLLPSSADRGVSSRAWPGSALRRVSSSPSRSRRCSQSSSSTPRSPVAARRRSSRASSRRTRARLARRQGRRQADGRRARRRAAVPAPRHQGPVGGAVAVVYTGSVPDLFASGRDIVVDGTLAERHLRRDAGLDDHEVPLEVHGASRPAQ